MFLDRHREIRATFDGGIVGDDGHFFAFYFADAGDNTGGRGLVVVHAAGRQRRQLQERRGRVQQALDALAREQLAARAVAAHGLLAAALSDLSQAGPQLGHQGQVVLAGGPKLPARRIDTRLQHGHGVCDCSHRLARRMPPPGLRWQRMVLSRAAWWRWPRCWRRCSPRTPTSAPKTCRPTTRGSRTRLACWPPRPRPISWSACSTPATSTSASCRWRPACTPATASGDTSSRSTTAGSTPTT